MSDYISGDELIELYETSTGDIKIMYRNLLKELAQENSNFAKQLKQKGIYVN